jgi:serine/threonine protein kinase
MLDDASSVLDDPLVGEVLGGTYRLVRRLGEGGMGAVYEASHTRLNKRFAVKTLHASIAGHPEAYKRFQREAQITSEIGHPHIIEVIDFVGEAQSGRQPRGAQAVGRRDDMPYLVMELLDGEELEDKLEREGWLPLEQVVTLLTEVASGLSAAHDAGVVHRDLKPQNIFLTRFGERGDFPKILDFGVSKIRSSESVLTQQQGAYLGTPQYMAPEQAKGQSAAVDARSDVFSLATIVYRALTGKDAFSADSIPGVLHAILNSQPPAPSTLRPELPVAIDEVLATALSKQSAQRFASARAFAEAFASASRGEQLGRTAANALAAEAVNTLVDDAPPEMESPPGDVQPPQPADESPLATQELLPRNRSSWLVVGLACAVVALAAIGWLLLRRAPQSASHPGSAIRHAPGAPSSAGLQPDAATKAAAARDASPEARAAATPDAAPAATRPTAPKRTSKTAPRQRARRRPARRPARGGSGKKPATAKPGSAYGEQPMAF